MAHILQQLHPLQLILFVPVAVPAKRVGMFSTVRDHFFDASTLQYSHRTFHLFNIDISCLKLYCQCFALSTTCGPKCKCQSCFNTTENSSKIEEARRIILERNPSAFTDKFRGNPITPTLHRPPPVPVSTHQHATPISSSASWRPSSFPTPQPISQHTLSMADPPNPPSKPSQTNSQGCKCRRSFCLKKVRHVYQSEGFIDMKIPP